MKSNNQAAYAILIEETEEKKASIPKMIFAFIAGVSFAILLWSSFH